MAPLTRYLIAVGESDVHRFQLANNGQEFVDQVFNFSNQSASGGKNKNTSKPIITIPSSSSSWNFVAINPKTLSLPVLSSSSNWKLLDARNIIEISTGKNIVCALLSCCSQPNEILFLIVTTTFDKLVPLKYVKVYKQSLQASFDTCKPRLIDGPGILWVHSCLHVATGTYGPVCCLTLKSYSLKPIDQILGDHQEESVTVTKQTFFSVLFYHYFQGMSLVVGTGVVNNNKENHNKTSFAVVFSVPVKFSSFKNLDISYILPEPYVSNVRHVKVLECKKTHDTENYCLNIRLFAVTCEGYLVEFHSGKLIRCLDISGIPVGVSHLTAIPTYLEEGSASSSWFPVIMTDEHKACVINPQLTKVHSVLDGFSDAFVRDFLGNGKSQLLFALLQPLTSEELNPFTNHWLLTDFDSCHFESGPNISQHEKDEHFASQVGFVAECPEAVQKALSNKIQMDILILEEKLDLLKIRNDFITNCWQRFIGLQSRSLKHHPLPIEKNPRLMPFVEGSAERVSPMQQIDDSCSVEIIRLWQKIHGDYWIVGVDFRYSKPKCLKKVSLLVTATSTDRENSMLSPGITFPNSILDSSQNSLYGQSVLWRPHSTSDNFTVTCALHPLPALTVRPTHKFLVLLCLHPIHEESEKQQILIHPCGTIDFGVQQLIGAALEGSSKQQVEYSIQINESSPYDACLLNALQTRCKVDIRSKKSQLTFLENHMKSFEEFLWDPFMKCFLYHSKCGPHMDARLTIDKEQPHHCQVSIFAREVTSIPAIIHFLYSRLPEDVVILPDVSISATKVCAWLQKIHSYFQILNEVFCSQEERQIFGDDENLAIGEFDQLTADLLDQIRQECKAKKQKMADRHLIDLVKCQPLISLLEKQKHFMDSLTVIF